MKDKTLWCNLIVAVMVSLAVGLLTYFILILLPTDFPLPLIVGLVGFFGTLVAQILVLGYRYERLSMAFSILTFLYIEILVSSLIGLLISLGVLLTQILIWGGMIIWR